MLNALNTITSSIPSFPKCKLNQNSNKNPPSVALIPCPLKERPFKTPLGASILAQLDIKAKIKLRVKITQSNGQFLANNRAAAAATLGGDVSGRYLNCFPNTTAR